MSRESPQHREQERSASSSVGLTSPSTETAGGPRSAKSAAPRRLGRFEVRELLGRGGFGAVYRAFDPQLDRDVALKLPRPELVDDERHWERFLREARAAAALNHPHIVPIYEAGRVGKQAYLTCGLIRGPTLAQRLKEQTERTPTGAAVNLIIRLARALHYAHSLGVVHRDIKPQNVILDERSEPAILDFGLARRGADESQHTQEGARVGTPAYMSPEQASGKSHQADGQSDQWALGVMLYELLAGQRPFRREGLGIFLEICHEECPPLRAIDASLSLDLDAIVAKTLRKAPAERYRDCGELADDLERFQRGEPVAARPQSWRERGARWTRRRPALAGLLAASVVLSVVLFIGLVHFIVTTNRQNETLQLQQLALDQALREVREQTAAAEAARREEESALAQQETANRELQAKLDELRKTAAERAHADQQRELAEQELARLETAREATAKTAATRESELDDTRRRLETLETLERSVARFDGFGLYGRELLRVILLARSGDLAAARDSLAKLTPAEGDWETKLVAAWLSELTPGNAAARTRWRTLDRGLFWSFDATERYVAVAHPASGDLTTRCTVYDLESIDQSPVVVAFPVDTPPLGLRAFDDGFVAVVGPQRYRFTVTGTLVATDMLDPGSIRSLQRTKGWAGSRELVFGPAKKEWTRPFSSPSKIPFVAPREVLSYSSTQSPHSGFSRFLVNAPVSPDFGSLWYRPSATMVRCELGLVGLDQAPGQSQLSFQISPRNSTDLASQRVMPEFKATAYRNSKLSGHPSSDTELVVTPLPYSTTKFLAVWHHKEFQNNEAIVATELPSGNAVTELAPHLPWLARSGFGGLVVEGRRQLAVEANRYRLITPDKQETVFYFATLGTDFEGDISISTLGRWLVVSPAKGSQFKLFRVD